MDANFVTYIFISYFRYILLLLFTVKYYVSASLDKIVIDVEYTKITGFY